MLLLQKQGVEEEEEVPHLLSIIGAELVEEAEQVEAPTKQHVPVLYLLA